MPACKKNRNKGFTLVEIISALAILILLGGLVLTSVSSVQHARVQHCAQIVKSRLESTRDLAKTRGTNVALSITKMKGGFKLTVSGDNLLDESTILECPNTSLFYYETGSRAEKQLGVDDAEGIDGTLVFIFDGGTGDMIGSHVLDYFIFANGSRNYTLAFQHKGGMVYYDYEVDEFPYNTIAPECQSIVIDVPYFVQEAEQDKTILVFTGTTLQPEFIYDSKHVKIGGIYRATDPSEEYYIITFNLKDPSTMKWADDTTEQKKLYWRIVAQS